MKIKLLAVLVMAGLLSACGPAQVKDDAATDTGRAADASAADAQTGGVGAGLNTDGTALAAGESNASYARNAINDANSVLAERVIYFDFDSDQISQDYMDLIAHHGKYLANNPAMSLRIEGHADERGTREYNVALGNRRAQSVRRLVLFQGVAAGQVSVISYGEEKPVALSNDDEAWRLNRRTELVYGATD
jgi:peptidoglycan-associated lipoprotein